MDLINGLKKIATDAEVVATEMDMRCREVPGLYTCSNVDRGLGAIGLEEWDRLSQVRGYTKNYLKMEDNSERADRVFNALRGCWSHSEIAIGNLSK